MENADRPGTEPYRSAKTSIGFTRRYCTLVLFIIVPTPAWSETDNSESSQFYHSTEARRDAEAGLKLGDWLSLSGQLEIERGMAQSEFSNGRSQRQTPAEVPTLELGLATTFNDWLSAEVLFEAVKDPDVSSQMDEGFITLEGAAFEISVGRQYLPFGEFYNHFITDPLVEFGETRGTALVVVYSPVESLAITGFTYEGDFASDRYDNDSDFGMGITLTNIDESVRFGAAYLSDLSEPESRILEEFQDTYTRRVPGFSTHLLVTYAYTEITLELIQAIHRFRELEIKQDKPQAINAEFAWNISANMQISWRAERSHELEDEPAQRFGFSLAWHPLPHLTLTFEGLRATYAPGFKDVDEDVWLSRRMEFVSLLTLAL